MLNSVVRGLEEVLYPLLHLLAHGVVLVVVIQLRDVTIRSLLHLPLV